MRHRFVRNVMAGITMVMGAFLIGGASGTEAAAEERCCMYNICHILWGDGCYGGTCECSVTGSCCTAQRPCASNQT